MKKFLWAIIITIIIIPSCINSTTKFIDTFVYLEDKQASVVSDSLLFGKSTAILKMGSDLVISKFKGDFIFTVYNLADRKRHGNFIRRGRGPGEIPHGYFVWPINDTVFISYNPEIGSFSRFLLTDSSIKWLSTYKFKYPVGSIIPINDSLLITSGNYISDYQYGIVNLKKDTLISDIKYPVGINDQLNSRQKASVYRTGLYKHPNYDMVVSVYKKQIILDIISFSGNKLNLLERKEIKHFKWTAHGNGRPLPSSFDIPFRVFTQKNFVTKDNIYLYYEYTNPVGSEEYWLLKFDWEGRSIGKYKMPLRIDELTYDQGVIYATALINDFYEIITINMD